jgi:hypothetical protein
MSSSHPGDALTFPAPAAAEAAVSARAAFIRRTYVHLAGAILAFLGVEVFLFSQPWVDRLATSLAGGQWFLVLIAFMAVGWVAEKWARSEVSTGMQYLGLGVYIVAEGLIFVPILYIARNVGAPDVIPTAGVLTATLFAALTVTVFVSGKDFSFLRSFLVMGSFVALGLIVAGWIFGFTLGLAFSGGMVIFASAAILYDTSRILRHYRTDQHVAASLSLFASVALLFWYVLQFLLQYTSSND